MTPPGVPAFALRYRLQALPRALEPVSPYTCSEGALQVLVAGKNLCEMTADPPWRWPEGRGAVRDHLFPYLPWLAEHLPVLLREDPLPLRLAAKTAADFERLGLAALKRIKRTPRLEQASEAFGDWVSRHALRAASDGGDPPNVFFRRLGDSVEVSWDNSRIRPYQGQNRYRYARGSARVASRVFELTVEDFILRLASELRARHPALREHPEIRDVLARLESLPG